MATPCRCCPPRPSRPADSACSRPSIGRRRQIARGIALVVWTAALVVLTIILVWLRGIPMLDLEVYRNGGLGWLHGIPLYVGFPGPLGGPDLPFTYPPLAAVLFSVFVPMPFWLSETLFTVGSFLALSVVTVVAAGRLDDRLKWTLGPTAAVLVLALQPVLETFRFGQVNLVLMALVTVDCLAVRRSRGVLVGLAAAIKLTPAVFVLYFLAKGDRRAAITSVASFAGFALVGFLLAPGDSREFWSHAMLDPDRITTLSIMTNESIRAELYRLPLSGPAQSVAWVTLAVVVLALAWRAARRARNDVVALVAIAIAGLLVSPIPSGAPLGLGGARVRRVRLQLWRDRAWWGLPLLLAGGRGVRRGARRTSGCRRATGS